MTGFTDNRLLRRQRRTRKRLPLGRLLSMGLVLVVLAAAAAGGRLMADPASAVIPGHGMVCTSGPTFDLVATDGYISLPDGNSIYTWSYAVDGGVATQFQYPGPTLCVNQGDTVTVNLRNDLPEDVSIIFPGQSAVLVDGFAAQPQFDIGGNLVSLTDTTAPATTRSYSFVAGEPGTYIYESGIGPHKQVQMGLIGALVVRPAMGPGFAYNDGSSMFDTSREYLLLFHEIDPALHRAVELGQAYNVETMHLRYWTINGRAMPDTIAENGAPWLPTQPYGALVVAEPYDAGTNPLPVLVRMANAGMENHPFHPHANHVKVLAQDGRLLQGPGGEDLSFERFGRTIAAGQTFDTLFSWTDVEGWDPNTNPVPVQIPGLQNLVFMDDVTYYAGSPYLGEKGDLPPGVTSFNQCGEQYFPWHSHALNEIQNFDEGFGGMMTLLRLDPPGGCP
jgi:FtsP/CotA-like multicopper oxidase with cupredoxin domain